MRGGLEELADAAVPLAAFGLLTHQIGAMRPSLRLTRRDAYRTIAVFVVTAAWDIVLRFIATGRLPLPVVSDWAWVRGLRPYFRDVGLVWAAVVAGAVGVMAYGVVRLWTPPDWPRYLAWVFAVSALVGLPMRLPPWFKALRKSYYDPLGAFALLTDGLSGIVVCVTMVLVGRAAGI